MAFLFKRRDSPFWWIRFRDPSTGKTEQRSTELRILSSAETRMAKAMQAEKTAAELRAPATQRSVDRWDRWAADYLEVRYATQDQSATKERVLINWANLRVFLAERGISRPRMLKRDHCFEYIKWRTTAVHGMRIGRQNTALLELKTLSVLMAEACRRGWASENPCRALGLKKTSPPQKPALEDSVLDEVASAIMEEPEPLRTIFMRSFLIARFQGCRLRETHINPQTDVILNDDRTRGAITFRLKGGRVHVAPLHPELLPLFVQLKDTGATETYPMPPGRTRLSSLWTKFLGRTGLKRRHPGLCFHSLRVTAVTRLARSNVPESKAMAFIGHATSTVHRIYQRLRLDDLDDCFGPLGSKKSPGDP